MIRETQEEIGVTPTNFTKMATITFDEWVNNEEKQVIMNVFVAQSYMGKMRPKWFNLNDIPYEKMFEDDKIWLPEVLKGNKLNAQFVFDKEFKMISSKIHIVNELENIKEEI